MGADQQHRSLAGLALAACLCLGSGLSAAGPAAAARAQVPSPAEHLGRSPGEDGYLVPYPQVLEYLRLVAAASDRVSYEVAGTSTLNNDLPLLVVTSPANQRRLDHYRDIARQLAQPRGLDEAKALRLAQEGKAVVLVTCSIHSTEVGSTQMIMEFVHDMATTRDEQVLAWQDEVILLLMPSINPDGQVLVVDWYNRFLGTEYEAGPMPWLYHHFVGHDNNRDFYMLTQKETRVVNEVLYHRWFPQVFLDEHQMGSTGPRMFVPPQTDPLAAEVHSLIFRQADMLGTAMGLRLEEAGKAGVGNNMIFDSYWPGGTRNTAWWKNVTGLLTEVASARLATPIYVEPGELRGGFKGLPEYTRRANYPSPWSGGWWRLRDIMDYELIATRSILESAATHKKSLLFNIYRMAREQMEAGAATAPYAFLLLPNQHDPVAAAQLIELMLLHGVQVERAKTEFRVLGRVYPAGTHLIPAAQPYRAFLLTMLRPQRYPEVTAYTGGPIIPPYDVTAWSLPLALGVDIEEAGAPLQVRTEPVDSPPWPRPRSGAAGGGHLVAHAADSVFALINARLQAGQEVYWLQEPPAGHLPGDVYLPPEPGGDGSLEDLATRLHLPLQPLARRPAGPAWRVQPVRIGLYQPWRASMDEGWTRFLLEQYGFAYRSIHNAELRDGSALVEIDVLLVPDIEASILEKGEPDEERRAEPLPPDYAGGLGDEGRDRLRDWVTKQGGTVIALDSSAAYFIKHLDLPVEDVLAGVSRDRLDGPGAMLRLQVDTTSPLAYGMRAQEAGYFASSPAFHTRPPDARFQRRVIASYPGDERDILLSGYLKGGDLLARRAAVVDLHAGTGRVVLIGFRPQHRAQPHRTFKLLFNALYLPRLEAVELGS